MKEKHSIRSGRFDDLSRCTCMIAMMIIFFALSIIWQNDMQSVRAASGTVNYAVSGGNIRFDKSTGYITGADKTITEAVIPSQIEGVDVIGVKQWAFYEDHSLKKVVLPDGVTDFEKGAFYGCDALEEIAIPEGTKEISEMQFYKCTALKKVSLPSSLEIIGRCAFIGCTSLEYVDIPGSVYKICNLAFDGCSGLKGVYFVDGVTIDMGTLVFNECYKLEKAVNVPDARWGRFIQSCKRALKYADDNCDLNEHTLMWRIYDDEEEGGLTKAQKEAAIRATAEEITAGCTTDHDKALAISQWIVKGISYERGHDNSAWAVYSGIIKNLEDGNGEKYLASCGGYSNLTQVFLQSLGIPTLTVWRNKRQGETIDHEFNMAYLDGKWCFMDTTGSDSSAADTQDNPDICWLDAGTAGFAYNSDHRVDYLLYEPEGDTNIYKEMPEDIEVEDDTKDWPDQNPAAAYVKGEGLTDPDWVHETDPSDRASETAKIAERKSEFPEITESDASLFTFDKTKGSITKYNSNSTANIGIPEAIDGVTVKAIGDEAFSGCKAEYITMPDSITEIGKSAFSGCRNLKGIHISENVAEIKTGTFSSCTALETITIPAGVKRMDGYIFTNCDFLEEILFEDYDFKEKCLASDPRGSEDDYASGDGNINWYAFKNVGRALTGLDYDASYKGTKWHRALQDVRITDDWRQNILEVYDSQLDYREGFSPYYVGGTNTKEYRTPSYASYWEWGHFSEAGKFSGVDGTTWCAAFASWVQAMAGLPMTIDGTSYSWKNLSFSGGDYVLKPGDIIGVGKTHVAMVGSAEEKDGYVEVVIINGNHPHRNVGKEKLRYEKISEKEEVREDFMSGEKTERYIGKAVAIEENGEWKTLSGDDADGFKIRSIWSPAVDGIVSYTLTLDPGEGTVSNPTRKIASEALYGALPDGKLDGYQFDGWYTEETGGEKILPYRMFKGASDQTLYAHYTKLSAGAVAGMSVNENDVSIHVKETKQLSVTFVPANPTNQNVIWRSSDTDVLTISDDGVIKGVSKGEAIVEARAAEGSDSSYCTVTVTEPGSSGSGSDSGSGGDTESGSGYTSKPVSESDCVFYAVEGGNIKFDKSTGVIVSADKTITAAVIPATIEGVAVKEIGQEAFYRCQSLKSITLPEGLEIIGQSGLENTALESVVVPDSVTYIAKWAFCVNKSLKEIVIGSGVQYIGTRAFIQDSALQAVYFKQDWSRIEMESDAFPDQSVFKIYGSGDDPGSEPGTEPGTEPGSEPGAEPGTEPGSEPGAEPRTEPGSEPGAEPGTEPGSDSGTDPSGTTKDEGIPLSERDISDSAEYEIDGLKWGFSKKGKVITSIPDSWTGGRLPAQIDGVQVTAIGNDAGKWHRNIQSLIIPEGVTDIGNEVFRSSHTLETLRIPSTMRRIGDYAFTYCDQLEDVVFAGGRNNLSCGYFAFRGCLFNHPDFSAPYKGSIYHEKLMQVELTGDFVEDVMAISKSQEGYHEGDSFDELDGSNKSGNGEFAEMNYYSDSPDFLWHPENYEEYQWGGWCALYCQWAYAMAGAPDEVMDVFAYKHQTDHTWDTTIYAGGTYELKRGDLIHFSYGHYAMVTDTDYNKEEDLLTVETWNGNPDVAIKTYEFRASDGFYYHDMGEQYKYNLLWYVPVEQDAISKVKSYKVTFDAAGGSVDKTEKVVYDGAAFGLLPEPLKEGYVFGGWYTNRKGTGKFITPYRTVGLEGDITVYAKWIDADGNVWDDPDYVEQPDDTADPEVPYDPSDPNDPDYIPGLDITPGSDDAPQTPGGGEEVPQTPGSDDASQTSGDRDDRGNTPGDNHTQNGQGDTGSSSTTGKDNAQGESGSSSTTGKDSAQGESGSSSTTGKDNAQGESGSSSTTGKDNAQGESGSSSTTGKDNAQGESGSSSTTGKGSAQGDTGNTPASGGDNTQGNNGGTPASGGNAATDDQSDLGKETLKEAVIKPGATKIKYSKIKKKAQSVKIKISGGKGKITYSNVSASKLKKYVKITKKGDVLTVKFKKKAKKGTYKIKVTVAAKGDYKKTQKVIKIKIS